MAVAEDLGADGLLAKEVQESPRGKPREELTSGWWDTAPPWSHPEHSRQQCLSHRTGTASQSSPTHCCQKIGRSSRQLRWAWSHLQREIRAQRNMKPIADDTWKKQIHLYTEKDVDPVHGTPAMGSETSMWVISPELASRKHFENLTLWCCPAQNNWEQGRGCGY